MACEPEGEACDLATLMEGLKTPEAPFRGAARDQVVEQAGGVDGASWKL